MFRRLLVLSLFAPLCLGGCGAVSGVTTAFEMPLAPTPSPRELARLKQTRGFDSLGKSLAKLNSKTVQSLFAPGQKSVATTPARADRQPAPFASNPASALANDLSRSANGPLAPRQIAVSVAPAQAASAIAGSSLRHNAARTLPARVVATARATTSGNGSDATRAFLRAWATRESLRRADDETLARRALEDRIALQGRETRPTVDLSLVSPETQLELSNLRLQLLPLLAIPAARRAQAQAQIEAIEARLNQIWQQETARQNSLLRQSLVEVPTRLRNEGEGAIEVQTRASASATLKRLAQVEREQQKGSRARTLPSLAVALRPARAPDALAVRGELRAPATRFQKGAGVALPSPIVGTTEISQRTSSSSNRTAQSVAAKNARVWEQATR